MANAILAFPRRQTHFPSDITPALPPASEADTTIPTQQLWRRLPADAFGEPERTALRDLLAAARPFGVEHWQEALAGDDAAAVAMALKLATIEYARAHGCHEIRTAVESNNPSMLAINRKFGFEQREGLTLFERALELPG